MAIYHLDAKIVSRSDGRSIVAAAAYRSGATLTDERTGAVQDYSRKQGVEHTEIMAPESAPEWMRERERLWNGVEAAEKRKDAQLAREIEVSLPRELSPEGRLELVRSYAQSQFVSQGMVADIAIHNPAASDGAEQPHAHILLTLREIEGQGFGKKAREWNAKERLEEWRSSWAREANRALEREGHAERIDHRTLEAQRQEALRGAEAAREKGDAETAQRLDVRAIECDREPQPKLGAAAAAMERQGLPTARGDELRAVEARNAERRTLWRDVRDWTQEIAQAARDKAEDLGERLRQSAGRLRAGLERARDWGAAVASGAEPAPAAGAFAARKAALEREEEERRQREAREAALAQERARLAQEAAARGEAERLAKLERERQAQKDRDYGFGM